MEIDSDPEESSSPSKKDSNNAPTASTELTPANRIAELNEIDQSIARLLAAASAATAILSNTPGPDTNIKTLETAQEAFKSASSEYFSTLSSIDVRLRRQVYALEEAGLIPAGSERDTRRGRTLATGLDGGDGSMGGRVAGGPLDPSWLNARVGDVVEARKKMELLKEARKLVMEMGLVGDNVVEKEESENMDVGEG